MKRAGLVAGVAACVLLLCVCGGFVSASRDVRGGQIYFESAPEDEFLTPAQQAEAEFALRDRAAKLQAAAEARAIAERQEHALPSGIAAMLEAGNDEAAPLIPQNVPGSPEAQLEAEALGPADPETERLTHIFSEEQFDEPHLPALSSLPPLDTSFLGLGSHQFLSQQAHQEVNAAVSADIAAAAEAALGAEAAVDADLDSEIAAEAQAETHDSLKTEAALEAEQAFMSEEQYPSLIETQAQPMFVEQKADSSAQNAQMTATQQTAAVEQTATAEQTMQAELAAAANAAAEARVQSELDAEEAQENREMAHVDNALATEMAMSFEEEYPSMIEQQGEQAADAQSATQSASDAAAEADVQSQLDAEEAAENHELAEVDEALAAENALDSEEQYPTMIEQQGEQAHSVQTGAESASDAAAETEVQSELDAEEAAENRELAEVDTALAAENALATEEEYPSMLEVATTTPRRQLHYPSGVQHSIKGVMTRLRGKIAAAAARQKEADQQAVAQSPRALLATSSKAGHGARAKAGDQWWLQQAPWFLPPPPEWGPMPVTMYTSYYHKPTPGPQHLDYAHGIPLPHAEQLGMARRTYPQPPYEQPLPLDMGLMEVSSESHATADAEAETEAEAGTEVDAEGAAMAEMQSELDAAVEEGRAIEAEELATAREVLEAETEAEALDDDE